MLYIQDKFRQTLKQDENLFDQMMKIDGKTFRALENRRTLQFNQNGKAYFIKQHFGVGWKEIFKNLFQLRLPVISAKNEWKAILKLTHLKVPTLHLVAYGERGFDSARKQSFMMTESLDDIISLEELCAKWPSQRPSFKFKLALIREIATIARLLHQHGMNHRDFYICHFLIKESKIENLDQNKLNLILIDLHRTQIRQKVPIRWLIKDLAGLYFSSMGIGLTRRDIFRFLSFYFEMPWAKVLKEHKNTLQKVEIRALALYRKTFGRSPTRYS